MRIEAYTQVQQVYKSNKNTTTAKTNGASKKDAVEISSMGRDFQIAKQAVNESADIRESLIAPIKAGIQNGTYEVSKESFADKLVEKYKELGNL